MKKIISNFLLLSFIIFITSCEGGEYANGVVVDSNTHNGIYGVKIESYVNQITDKPHGISYSDTNGNYSAGTGIQGAVRGLPKLIVRYSKAGYQTLEMTSPKNDTILLLR